MKILILGADGFIGSHLCSRILEKTDWEVVAIDLKNNFLKGFSDNPNFEFFKGDITINKNWVEFNIKECDVVIPLVAIAQPKQYVQNPLLVFELTFEANLEVIRLVAKYQKRLIFPSSSEVYGMSMDECFSEDSSNLSYGPVNKSRWIYATSKQLLDRIIFSYGMEQDLRYTIFRPFNWIGPNLDNLYSARQGNSRVLTQFIANLFSGDPLQIVHEGEQKRCFTDAEDAIDALMKIIEREAFVDKEIINIGNPENETSIKDLAILTQKIYANYKGLEIQQTSKLEFTSEHKFYGEGFQDVTYRKPDINKAIKLLDWKPHIDIEISIGNAVDSWAKKYG